MTYEPNFDIDFRYGQQGEQRVDDIVHGLIDGRTEVKRDAKWFATGNIYVEQECRRQGEYKPSGLTTTEAEQWVFVLGSTGLGLIIETEVLRDLLHVGKAAEERDGSHPTKGVVLPVSSLLNAARSRYVRLNGSQS